MLLRSILVLTSSDQDFVAVSQIPYRYDSVKKIPLDYYVDFRKLDAKTYCRFRSRFPLQHIIHVHNATVKLIDIRRFYRFIMYSFV